MTHLVHDLIWFDLRYMIHNLVSSWYLSNLNEKHNVITQLEMSEIITGDRRHMTF